MNVSKKSIGVRAKQITLDFLKKEVEKRQREADKFEKKANLENFNPSNLELYAAEMSWIRNQQCEKIEYVIELLSK